MYLRPYDVRVRVCMQDTNTDKGVQIIAWVSVPLIMKLPVVRYSPLGAVFETCNQSQILV